MSIVQSVLIFVLYAFMLVLIARLVFEIVQSFARAWSPSGFVLVVAESIYTATDPPLRFLRRFIRPIRLGGIALDLSFTALFLIVVILIRIVASVNV